MAKVGRRGFLFAGVATAAAAAFGVAIQPKRQTLRSKGGSPRAKSLLHVAVVGGGLAGLSTALELAERGVKVSLFETSPHLGGKLGGWQIDAAGERFAMEHGFHGFFSQYYNLRDVLRRLQAIDALAPTSRYPIAFKDGSEESFSAEALPFPLNLLSLYSSSKRMHWRSILKAGPRMQALLRYDPVKTYAELDSVSFAEYAQGLDPDLVEAMLWPFAKTTLNHPARTSAAHVLRFMHFYFLGNPEGLSYRFTRDDCMHSIINPWAARLRTLGVKIMTNTPVHGLAALGTRISGVHYGHQSESARLALLDAPLTAEARQVGLDARGAPIFAWQREGARHAVRGACTHQGCPLALSARGFDCSCHGGRFDREGVPYAGPPTRPLERLRVTDDGVFADSAGVKTLAVDAVVLATDVRGTRAIVAGSTLDAQLMREVAALAEADPYLVVRAWLDKRARPDRSEFYTTSAYSLLDSIALYDQLQTPYRQYAERTGHGVVELHSYGIDPSLDGGPERNRDVLLAEMRRALPELADARVLDQVTMQQSNFSGFPPGSHAHRPTTTAAAHDNLFFAGDWVKSDLPIALMEAAVTTGRLAANAVLQQHDIRGVDIETVAHSGF